MSTVIDYCGRPACRKEFLSELGRGRPKVYCSEECRRSAQTEYRQALSRVQRVERYLSRLRADLACFEPDAAAVVSFVEVRDHQTDLPPHVDGVGEWCDSCPPAEPAESEDERREGGEW